MQGEKGSSNSLIMSRNGLAYKMPQSLSTTVNRTFRREYAQRSSYTAGNTIVFDWNTGTSFVDPDNAMITFDLQVNFAAGTDAAEVVTFGSGCGACNILSEIRIMSKNGTELDRIQSANILAKILTDWTYNDHGLDYLQMAGKFASYSAPADGTIKKFVIPLKVLSGFFRPSVAGMLIPSGIASGLRLEFVLQDAARALTKTAGTGTGLSYTVTDPEMLLMLHDLNDPTQAVLMSESSSNGLEYTFPSYFASTTSTVQTQVHEQSKKAVSQATRVYTNISDASGAASVLLEDQDGFSTVAASQLSSYQYRVGSSYFPQNVIESNVEAWYVTSATFGKNKDTDNPSSLNLSDYDTGDKFLVGVPLATNDRLNLSGLPINNSSVLELRLNVANAGGLTREITTFMEYVSVARNFATKTSIKI